MKKSQGLPLNTIVIALLVIIVLVVIVVFFTSKTSESGKTIDDTREQLLQCSFDNSIITGAGYTSEKYSSIGPTGDDGSCGDNDVKIPGVGCCATPRTSTDNTFT